MNFFFWFFLAIFLVAAFQDLKRREVDNWLNLFLFFSGFLYLIYLVFINQDISILINFSFLVFFMFFLSHLFYLSRFFAGGDCKLLFALTPLLISFNFFESLLNIFYFIFILLVVGAIYGLFWIVFLFFKDLRKNKKDFFILFKKNYLIFIFLLLFAILGFLDYFILYFSLMMIFMFFLFLCSKAIEKNSLTISKKPSELREGDWPESDINFKGKIMKSSFDGLSLEEIKFLQNYKGKIKIKDGIPFAPVFVFSWIGFYFIDFFKEVFFSILVV